MSDQPEKAQNSNQMLKGIGIGLAIAAIVGGLLYSGLKPAIQPAPSMPHAVAADPAASQSDADFSASVDKLLATLPAAPETASFVKDKGKAVKAAILKGDYASAQKIADDVFNSSKLVYGYFRPFNRFIGPAGFAGDDTYLKHLNEWIAQSPKSIVAYALRSGYYYDTAWWIRGKQFNNKTNPADAKIFSDDIPRAVADGLKVIELAPESPYGYYLTVNAASSFGNSPALDKLFQAAHAKFPDYYEIASKRLYSLTPKWGGSIDAMYGFVDQNASHAADTSPLRLLYVELYDYLINSAEMVCNEVPTDKSSQCIGSVMGKLVRPGLEKQVNESLQLYSKNDPYLFSLRIKTIIERMQGEGQNATAYSGAVLQLAADAMGSDNQLIETSPGHNNYVMDELTADNWLMAKHYDNAIKKYREALDDTQHMKFPDEETKTSTLAGLYADLGQTIMESSNPDRVQSVAYLKEASKLGNDKSHVVCQQLYQIKDYPGALRECTASYQATSYTAPLYWRARSYTELGNLDAALEDYKSIADDQFDTYRENGVVDGSDVLGRKNDPQGMIDWFARYPFVFDEASTKITQETLRNAYNNRCYAYMKLNQLQKALDDCTASLRHGSLPDAYSKQQQLVKMLKK